MADPVSKMRANGASGIKVIDNPGAATKAVGPDGKHKPATKQGTTPPDAGVTFSSR